VTLAAWLSGQPFSLTLSAGFFGFFAHTGLMLALEEAGLAPVRLSGASAGALVAGLWAAGLPAFALAEELIALERHHFWDPRPGLGLLAGGKFRQRLAGILPVQRLEACPRKVIVVVHDILARRPVGLEVGDLAAAIHASCALPPLFHPVKIEGRYYTDGGWSDREALSPLPAGTRVLYHHIVNCSPFHLPWERRAMDWPSRDGLTTLAIAGLDEIGPFSLARGRKIIASAHAAARLALHQPIAGGAVRIRAS
jgi:NTE family protein